MYPLTLTYPSLPHLSTSGNNHSTLCLCRLFDVFRFYKWDHIVVVFLFGLLILSMMPSRFIHVDTNDRIFFFFYTGSITFQCVCATSASFVCISFSLPIYLPNGCLTYFHVLVIVNNATVNMGMQLSLQYGDFIFSDIQPKGEWWIIR